MVQIHIHLDGGRCSLAMDGHATGSGAVCAACSALVYALAGYLCNAGDHLSQVGEQTLEPGRARLVCAGDASVEAAYHMAGIGFLQMARRYPRCLDVSYTAQ